MVESTTVIGTIVSGTHDNQGNLFGGINIPTGPNFFMGRDAKALIFTNQFFRFTVPELPPNVKVTNAFISLTARADSAGGDPVFDAEVGALQRDGKWNTSFFDGWTRWLTLDQSMQVIDTGDTAQITVFAGTSNLSNRLRGFGGAPRNARHHLQLAQSFTNTTGSDFTLGSVSVELFRFSAPTPVGTEIGLEVYQGDIFTGFISTSFPDKLASSSGIVVEDIATIPADYIFNFEGDNQINISSVTLGNFYIVTLTGTYNPSPFGFIVWTAESTAAGNTYTGGNALISGTGYAFDEQNYPNVGSMLQVPLFEETATWAIPEHLAGDTINSSDISNVVQQAINDFQYADDDERVIGIEIDNSDSDGTEQAFVAASEHPVEDPPLLTVTYKPRRVQAVI